MNAAKRLELALRRRFPGIFIVTFSLPDRVSLLVNRKTNKLPHGVIYSVSRVPADPTVGLRDASKFILNTFYGAPCARI